MNEDATKRSALLVTTLSSFLTPFMGSSVSIALPSIARAFEMDAVLLSWVATSYLLTGATFLVPFGRVADIYGRRKIFQYGMVLFTLASLLLPFSTSATFLILLRLLQGFGSSMTYSTGLAILIAAFPPGERGRVLGINVAAVYSGLSAGPFIGGFLTQHFGWRSIFISAVAPCVIILYYAFWKLKGEWIEAKGEKFDLTGAILYSLALMAMMYGFTLLPDRAGVGLILVGTVGILLFIKLELKMQSPVLDLNLFIKNRVFTFSNVTALINYSATYSATFLLSLYLQYTKGLNPQSAGLILVSQPLVQAILSPFAGKLSDRIDPRIVSSIGMTFTMIGLASFIFLTEETTLLYIIVTLILLGVGFALFSSPNANAAMSSVEKKSFGVASAILSTMRQSGMMLSMGIVTVIFSIYIGRVQITPEYYSLFLKSLRLAFTLSAVLCLGGIFASFPRSKR